METPLFLFCVYFRDCVSRRYYFHYLRTICLASITSISNTPMFHLKFLSNPSKKFMRSETGKGRHAAMTPGIIVRPLKYSSSVDMSILRHLCCKIKTNNMSRRSAIFSESKHVAPETFQIQPS